MHFATDTAKVSFLGLSEKLGLASGFFCAIILYNQNTTIISIQQQAQELELKKNQPWLQQLLMTHVVSLSLAHMCSEMLTFSYDQTHPLTI